MRQAARPNKCAFCYQLILMCCSLLWPSWQTFQQQWMTSLRFPAAGEPSSDSIVGCRDFWISAWAKNWKPRWTKIINKSTRMRKGLCGYCLPTMQLHGCCRILIPSMPQVLMDAFHSSSKLGKEIFTVDSLSVAPFLASLPGVPKVLLFSSHDTIPPLYEQLFRMFHEVI